MKLVLFVATALISISAASGTAFAASFDGRLVSAPARVHVIGSDGIATEYGVSAALNAAYVDSDLKTLTLTENSVASMCADYLGQLAEDVSVTVETDDGVRKTATIRAASGKQRKVSVYGTCGTGANALDQLQQLQIDVKVGEGPEIR